MNNTFKTVMTIVGLLLIGYVIGFQHHRYLTQQQLRHIAELRLVSDKPVADRIMSRMQLNDEQRTSLQPIIEKYMSELRAVDRNARELKKPIIDTLRAEMRTHLNEDQQAEFEKILHRITSQHRERRKPPKNKKTPKD